MANKGWSPVEKEDMFVNPQRMSLYNIIKIMPLDQLKHFLGIVNLSTDGSISDLRLRLYRHEIQHSPNSELLSVRMEAMKLHDQQSRDRQQKHNFLNQRYGVGVLGQPKPAEQPHVENNISFHAQQAKELLHITHKQRRKELVALHRKRFQLLKQAMNPSDPLIGSGIPNPPAVYGPQFQMTSTNDTWMPSERIGINPSPGAGVEYQAASTSVLPGAGVEYQTASVDAWCTGMQHETMPRSTRLGAQNQKSFDEMPPFGQLKIKTNSESKQLLNQSINMQSQFQQVMKSGESAKKSAKQREADLEKMQQELKIMEGELREAIMDVLQKSSKKNQSVPFEQGETKSTEENISGSSNTDIEDCEESSSESEDNDEDDDIEHRLKCMDLLKTWNLQFHGLKGAEASEFIGYLKDFRKFAKFDDIMLLEMLPAILDDNTRKWYRNKKFDSWKTFEKAFNVEYVAHCEA